MRINQSPARNSRRDSSSHRTHRGLLQVATVTTDFVRSQMPGGRSRGLGVHGRATTATMAAVTAVLMFDAASAHLVVTSPASLVGTVVETATYRNYGPQGGTLINAEVVFLQGDAFCKPDPMAVRNKVVMTSRRRCAAPYRELAAAGTWGPLPLPFSCRAPAPTPHRLQPQLNINDRQLATQHTLFPFRRAPPRPGVTLLRTRRRRGAHHRATVARGGHHDVGHARVRLRCGRDARAKDHTHGGPSRGPVHIPATAFHSPLLPSPAPPPFTFHHRLPRRSLSLPSSLPLPLARVLPQVAARRVRGPLLDLLMAGGAVNVSISSLEGESDYADQMDPAQFPKSWLWTLSMRIFLPVRVWQWWPPGSLFGGQLVSSGYN